jgi:hypothetical protein
MPVEAASLAAVIFLYLFFAVLLGQTAGLND